jgi:DNA-binding XRE family transcriptional regulator
MRSKVPQSVISEIENGNEIPSVLTALKLAKALSVRVEDIFML